MKSLIARGLKWQAISAVGRQLLSLLVFTVLARLLEPSAFGLVGLVGVYLAFVSIIADQGIATALIQRENLEPEHRDAAFWFSVGGASLLALATVGLAGPVAALFHEPQLAPLLVWSAPGLVIGALASVHGALFVRELDFRRPAMRNLCAALFGGLVGIGMAVAGYGVWALVGQQLASTVASTVFLWIASDYRPAFRFSIRHFRELFGMSFSVFSTGLLWFVASRVDQIVIGRVAGPAMLGLYVVGGKLPGLLRTVMHQPLGDLALPALSRVQGDPGRMREVIYKGMELNSLISLPVFVGLAAVAPTLVPVVFGPPWISAIPFLELIALYTLALGLFTYCHPALLATGASRSYLAINTVCALGAVAACVVGIAISLPALILGLLVNVCLTNALSLLVLRARLGLSPWRYCRPIFTPALAAAAMFFAVRYAAPRLDAVAPGLPALALQIALGALVYGAVLLALAFPRVSQLWQIAQQAISRPAAVPQST